MENDVCDVCPSRFFKKGEFVLARDFLKTHLDVSRQFRVNSSNKPVCIHPDRLGPVRQTEDDPITIIEITPFPENTNHLTHWIQQQLSNNDPSVYDKLLSQMLAECVQNKVSEESFVLSCREAFENLSFLAL